MAGVIISDKATAEKFNRVCREQMKAKLLSDILVDLTVCDLEGWDKTEYITELKAMLDEIAANFNKGTTDAN